MLYKIFALLLFVSLLFPFAGDVHAAKKRAKGPIITYTGGSFSTAKLSRPTNSIVLTFINLGNVKKISYTLSYRANNISQGAIGSFVPSGQSSDGREVYFGTCSKGVCTPHRNIKNATLTVTTTLKNGARNVKRYTAKI